MADALRAYGLIVAMWVRSTMAYRASFAMTTLGNFAATAFDFVAILLMFSHVDALGGYSLPEIAFLYGTTSTAFGLADLVMGSMDRLGRRVRDGTLDTLPGGTVLGGLALQAWWAAALFGLGAWLTARATRRVVVQGG